jgi:hypothetical protein
MERTNVEVMNFNKHFGVLYYVERIYPRLPIQEFFFSLSSISATIII